ncbi:hypothetical protein [Pleionea sediminis]|uniref:hypothetical protein n=1 Tax=Pleionea sediminis TaxID=2569479 RepID=UPI001184F173|nr:hypothetical protein [Pleionea sediminis]
MKLKSLLLTAVLLNTLIVLSGCKNGDSVKTSDSQKESDNPIVENSETYTAEQKQDLKNLLWVNSIELDEEIKAAREKDDKRIFVLATRGITAPGIEPNELTELLKKCGQKYLPGAGDTLTSEAHQKLYKKALDYAKSYNQSMKEFCLNPSK